MGLLYRSSTESPDILSLSSESQHLFTAINIWKCGRYKRRRGGSGEWEGMGARRCRLYLEHALQSSNPSARILPEIG
jgi:hypothetical protein